MKQLHNLTGKKRFTEILSKQNEENENGKTFLTNTIKSQLHQTQI